MTTRRRSSLAGLAWLFLALIAPGTRLVAQSLPDRLSDTQFWRLVTDFSEPGGVFLSENFLSNEAGFQYVIPELKRNTQPGGVYLGVGPEQNFTYIAALRPRMAFIVDIRRQAMLQHLLYKAVFEMADSRAGFLSLLFSRPRPSGIDTLSTPDALFAAFDSMPADSAMFARTLSAIQLRLVKTHGFTLSDEDLNQMHHVFYVMFLAGPHLNYGSSAQGGNGSFITSTNMLTFSVRQRGDTVVVLRDTAIKLPPDRLGTVMTTVSPAGRALIGGGPYARVDYTSLMAQTDGDGVQRSFLANETNYRAVRDMQARNLVVPIVGDFAGPTALRSVGQYLKDHRAVVTAFYLSNVEQYLFQNGVWRSFYGNVASLPIDSGSMMIRSLSGGGFYAPTAPSGIRLTSALGLIVELLDAFQAGRIDSYASLISLSHQ